MNAAPTHPSALNATCFAPAKINLALHVTGLRSDGFHELETLAAFCDIGDQLTIRQNPDGPKSNVTITASGPFGGALPPKGDNIVQVAAMAFMRTQGAHPPAMEIEIEKNLPVASGIGGGSADAAATLLALTAVAGQTDQTRLMNIAETLGSDVPMCLHSRPLIARGRGEAIEMLDNFPPLHLVLVNPGVAVSTPEVFKALKEKTNPPLAPLPAPSDAGNLVDWLHAQRNDLEAPAKSIAPEIAIALEAINETAPRLARMSGSGATCFGMYDSGDMAAVAALQIRQNHPDWWVVATRTRQFGHNRAALCE